MLKKKKLSGSDQSLALVGFEEWGWAPNLWVSIPVDFGICGGIRNGTPADIEGPLYVDDIGKIETIRQSLSWDGAGECYKLAPGEIILGHCW